LPHLSKIFYKAGGSIVKFWLNLEVPFMELSLKGASSEQDWLLQMQGFGEVRYM